MLVENALGTTNLMLLSWTPVVEDVFSMATDTVDTSW